MLKVPCTTVGNAAAIDKLFLATSNNALLCWSFWHTVLLMFPQCFPVVYMGAIFICFLSGFFTPFVYITDHAIHVGVSTTKAVYLLSVLGLCNTIGTLCFLSAYVFSYVLSIINYNNRLISHTVQNYHLVLTNIAERHMIWYQLKSMMPWCWWSCVKVTIWWMLKYFSSTIYIAYY